jgi:hypothetical protein
LSNTTAAPGTALKRSGLFSPKARLNYRKASLVVAAWLMVGACSCSPGIAGTTNELAVDMRFPGAAVPPGAPPPPGSGPNPPRLIEGDGGASPRPPSGRASGNTGEQQSPRSIVNVMLDVPDPQKTFGTRGSYQGTDRPQPGGNHVVLTFRADTLTAEQRGKVQGILGGNLSPASSFQNITASMSQIERLQNALYPSPSQNAVMINNGPNTNRKAKSLKVFARPAQGYPKPGRTPTQIFTQSNFGSATALEDGKLTWKSQLTTVRGFCRYLVLGGVVFATVLMIMAAYGLIQGNRHAGGRVLSAAGGLILLLMSYSIWKVLVTNSSRFPDVNDQGLNPRWRQKGGETDQRTYTVEYSKIWDKSDPGSEPKPANYAPNTTPQTPANADVARSNMKVKPLGAQFLR